MRQNIGSVSPRGKGWRVTVTFGGQRFRIGTVRISGTNTWVSIPDRPTAELVLTTIRARLHAGMDLEVAVAPFRKAAAASAQVDRLAERFLLHERRRCEAGDLSPNTLRETARFCTPRTGEFAYWGGRDAHTIEKRDLKAWHLALRERPLSQKTAAGILGEFRRMLRWARDEGFLLTVPDFPTLKLERKPPEILKPDEQRAVLDAIPFEERGVFLAMAHTLRQQEARALDLTGWREPYLIVKQAAKLPNASAPIRGLKTGDWRAVGATEELVAWIHWRLERASSAELLRRRDVWLFPHWKAANARKLWSAWAIRAAWVRASKAAGVRYVAPYPSTRHSTATDLIRTGANQKQVQTLLGHRAAKSTERYVVLAGAEVQDLLRDRIGTRAAAPWGTGDLSG